MGLVCLVCGNETDLEELLSLPEDAPLLCPFCDDVTAPIEPFVEPLPMVGAGHHAA